MRVAAPTRAATARVARKLGGALPPAAIGALILGPGAARASYAWAATARAGGEPVTVIAATAVAAAGGAEAREVDLQETGHLHAVGEPGDTIDEQGHASGTYSCSISVHLTIVAANRVSAAFTVKPTGGSITGTGSARFEQQGVYGYFGGTIAIARGTGSFAHASGANIGVSGVIDRETLALTVHVNGKFDR